MPNVGYATLQIVPSMRGVQTRIRAGLGGSIMGRQFGNDFERGAVPAMGRVFGGIGRLAVRTGAIVAVAGGGLAAWGLKSAADMQQVEIAFEGILGSGEKAKAFLDELRGFAAKTPFEFPELADASKQLLAVGFSTEDVLPIMTKLGNVAATLGVGGPEIQGVVRALGQMKGKGKASAEELQQISEQIPGFSAIKAIADSMGISTADAFEKMAAGAIPADEAITAILEGMDRFPGAAGAMERQSQTLTGVLSTLKDTARDALVGGLAPALPALAKSVQAAAPSIAEGLGGLASSFGGVIQGVVDLLPKIMPVLSDVVSGVGKGLSGLAETFGPVLEKLAPVFSKLFDAIGPVLGTLARTFAPIIEKVGGSLLRVGTAIARALLPVVRQLGPIIRPLANAFAKVFNELARSGVLKSLGLAVANLVKAFLPLIPILVQVIQWTAPILVLAGRLAAVLINVLAGAVRWVAQAFADAWNWIRQAAIDAYNFVNANVIWPLVSAYNWLKDQFWTVVGALGEAWEWIKTAARNAYKWISDKVIEPLVRGFKKVVGVIQDIISALAELVGGMAESGVKPGIQPGDLIPGLASGGPARGLRWVGEDGPELAWFGGSGGHVFSNPQSQRIASATRVSDGGGMQMRNFNPTVIVYGDEHLRQQVHAALSQFEADVDLDLAANGM